MMTREELETAKKRRAWRMEGKGEKEPVAEGFPEYAGDVTEMTLDAIRESKEEY